jgi:Transglycosylase SLT domain
MTALTTIIAAVILNLYPKVPTENATVYATAIEQASRTYDIEWPLITALLYRESHFNPVNVSPTNDYGIGQHHCPSFYCQRKPTPEQKACMLDAACNIDLTAQELVYKMKTCHRMGRRCTDFVQLYNPGSPGYARRTRAVAKRIERMAAKQRLLLGPPDAKPIL